MLRKSKLRNRMESDLLGSRMPQFPGSGSPSRLHIPPTTNLTLLLRGSSGCYVERTSPTTPSTNGNPIGTWVDVQSSLACTAPADNQRPTYTLNGSSKPVSRGDGTNDCIDAALNVSGYTAITVGVSCAPKNTTQSGIVSFCATANSGSVFILFQRDTTNLRVYVNGGYRWTIAHATDTYKTYVLTGDGTTWKLWVDGVAQSDYTGGWGVDKGTATHLWVHAGYPTYSNSDVGGVAVYNAALDATSAVQLSTYLASLVA